LTPGAVFLGGCSFLGERVRVIIRGRECHSRRGSFSWEGFRGWIRGGLLVRRRVQVRDLSNRRVDREDVSVLAEAVISGTVTSGTVTSASVTPRTRISGIRQAPWNEPSPSLAVTRSCPDDATLSLADARAYLRWSRLTSRLHPAPRVSMPPSPTRHCASSRSAAGAIPSSRRVSVVIRESRSSPSNQTAPGVRVGCGPKRWKLKDLRRVR
jgi:hypothetical protein